MKLKQTMVVASVVAMVASFGFVFAPAPQASALDCTVLPQRICNDAQEGTLEESGTWQLLLWVLGILTAGVGLVAVAMIGYAGFKYATAQDNESQTKEAKEMIRNVIVGIAVFALMWAASQWLIPGGIFR
jgi:hypothetical protein